MELVVVGSGTAAVDGGRVCSAYWVEAGERRILFDCGPGAVHRMAQLALPWSAVSDVVLSHFHNDHTGDLPFFLFALRHGLEEPREDPLRLIGPAGTGERLGFMAAAFGDHVLDPGFPLVVLEAPAAEAGSATVDDGARSRVPGVLPAPARTAPALLEADGVDLGEGLRLRAIPARHTPEALAWRLEGPSGTLAYTGDTGPSARLAEGLAGADVLVAECALPDEESLEIHLTPRGLADLAARASPRLLVLTHVYPQLDRLDPAARVREAGWQGPLVRARDGLRLTFGSGGSAR